MERLHAFASNLREYLNEHFPNRWIGRGEPIRWAPRSPDLTPPDFVLWGHAKNHVQKPPVDSGADLKKIIENEIKINLKKYLI